MAFRIWVRVLPESPEVKQESDKVSQSIGFTNNNNTFKIFDQGGYRVVLVLIAIQSRYKQGEIALQDAD